MPTVDRKNTDTDEKHSLSSFDKRKVQMPLSLRWNTTRTG